MTYALGTALPPLPHAISVSLPAWKDNVGYQEGEKRVVDAMVTGYPRFVIHNAIQRLARHCSRKFGSPGEGCMLFPSHRAGDACSLFLSDRAYQQGLEISSRVVQYTVHGPSQSRPIELYIVFFPENHFSLAKQFWQHTGLGISSRLAQRCLSVLDSQDQLQDPAHETYLRESEDQKSLLENGSLAKQVIKGRIADLLTRELPLPHPEGESAEVGSSISTTRIREVSEDDVYLYPSGMAAIWSSHQLVLGTRPPTRSVCFGFPYTDTSKILEKWGPGCFLLGHGWEKNIVELEEILERESFENPGRPPISALFTEFPSNPLLRCPDLARLRALADKYDFVIVVDDTIGTFVNVEVLSYTDIVVTSLSKFFSGSANVLGGSLVLNSRGKHYSSLKSHITKSFEDIYFDEDALHMERNSRDFARRIRIIDENAEAACDFFVQASSLKNTVLKEVFYPKYVTPEHYNKCKVSNDAGYCGLFSLTFTTPSAARAFYDALPCAKGPSLGTNFTLACPYTILAHYCELEWAAEYGIEEHIVRISVGMEDKRMLLEGFTEALKAAEATLVDSNP